MKWYKIYSGSIAIGKVRATNITVATKKAVKMFYTGIWLRPLNQTI